MKVHITLVALCFVMPFSFLKAQSIEWGEPLDTVRSLNHHDHNGNLYGLRKTSSYFTFYKYNDLNYVSSTKYELSIGTLPTVDLFEGYSFKDVNRVITYLTFQDKDYVLMSSGGFLEDVLWSIDLVPFVDGEIRRDEAINVLSSKDEEWIPGNPKFLQKIFYAQSPDKSKIAVGIQTKMPMVWDYANLAVAVIDESMQRTKKGFCQYPHRIDANLGKFSESLSQFKIVQESSMRILGFEITNEAAIISTGKVLIPEKEGKYYPYKYSLFKYDFTDSIPDELKLHDVPDYQERDIEIHLTNSGKTLVHGFYSEGGGYKAIEVQSVFKNPPSLSFIGTIYQQVDNATFTSDFAKHALIPVELLCAFEKKPDKLASKIERKGIGQYGLYFTSNNTRMLPNGDIAMMELNYERYRSNVKVNDEYKIRYRNEGAEILVLGSDGVLKSRERLWLRQDMKEKRSDVWGMTYGYLADGSAYFIYNGCPKNLNITEGKPKKYKGQKNSVLTLAILSPDGTLTKTALQNNKKTKILPRFWTRETVGNHVYLYGDGRRNTTMMGRITLPNGAL